MGTKFELVEAPKEKYSGNKRGNRQAIGELLKDGQYVKAVQQLDKILDFEEGGDPYLTHILTAARQICLICKQVHAETELHQKAHEEAVHRERELQQQLTLILDLLGQYLETDITSGGDNAADIELRASEKQKENGENGRSWWQRIRSWFEVRSAGSVTTASLSTVEKEGKTTDGTTAVVSTAVPVPISPPQANSHFLSIYCLGAFRVYYNEQQIENWVGNKSKSIFKYLITHPKQAIHREVLMDQFWRDTAPQSARRNLYQAIYLLRQVFQSYQITTPLILYENNHYSLNPDIPIWVDSAEFETYYHDGQKFQRQQQAVEAMAKFQQAERIYEGDFLDEDIYEDWVLVYRENLKLAYLDILDQLGQYYWRQNQFALSIIYCQKILAVDDCREDAHRRLMMAYMRQGQRPLALRQFHQCAEALQSELDVLPMPATMHLYHQIQKTGVQYPSIPKMKEN